MKKLVMVLLFAVVTIVSCKQELPSNIKSSLDMVNFYANRMNSIDSIIFNLSKNEIDKLSKDSISSLLYSSNAYSKWYHESYNELEELLKYSPQFSDYDEIINRRYHFTIEKRLPYNVDSVIIENKNYMENKILYYMINNL